MNVFFICNHRWNVNLIFCEPPKTHADVKECMKCGKQKIIFKGSRSEWRAKHGIKDVKI